jgi:chromosome segregation ATPase
VPCEVRKYKERGGITAEDWMLKDLIETNLRQRGVGNLNPMKTARCVRELEKIYGIKQGRPKKQDTLSGFRVNSSQSQLAETIGITERQLRRLDKLNELIPQLQALIEQGSLSASTGTVLAYLEPEQQKKLYDTLGSAISKLQKSEVEAIRKQIRENKKQFSEMQHRIAEVEKEKREIEETKKRLEHRLAEIKPEVVEKVPADYIQTKKALEAVTDRTEELTSRLKKIEEEKSELEKQNRQYFEELKRTKKERDKYIEELSAFDRARTEEKYNFQLTQKLSDFAGEISRGVAELEMLLEKKSYLDDKNTQILIERIINNLDDAKNRLSRWRLSQKEVIEIDKPLNPPQVTGF